MKLLILSDGCPSCDKMFDSAREAVAELMLNASVEKTTSIAEIMKYNVIATPALVIDDEVVSVGKKLNKKQITSLLLGEKT